MKIVLCNNQILRVSIWNVEEIKNINFALCSGIEGEAKRIKRG
jgi:hypothetical protein